MDFELILVISFIATLAIVVVVVYVFAWMYPRRSRKQLEKDARDAINREKDGN